MRRRPDLRADAGVGEQLEQQRVRHAPVDDVRGADAAVDRVAARLELGAHAAEDAVERRRDLVGARLADERAPGRPCRAASPIDVGEEDELVGADRARHGARGLVGVDVVRVALAVGGDRRDDRDVVARDVADDVDVDALDAPDEADVLAARRAACATARKSWPSSPLSPTAGWPWRLMRADDVLVDLADEDHLRDLDGLLVAHPQAADELDRHVEALHVARDLRPAAVDDDRVRARRT